MRVPMVCVVVMMASGCDVEPIVGSRADPGAAASYAGDCRAASYAQSFWEFGSAPTGVPYAEGAASCDFAVTTQMNSPTPGCGACWCGELECTGDADCPAPQGGGNAVCDEGYCVQTCVDDGDCPDAMSCALRTLQWPHGVIVPEGTEGVWRCVWPIEDEFTCRGYSEYENPCQGLDDEASCNARVSSELPERCQWTEFEVLAPDSCEVLDTAAECLWMRGTECGDANLCGDGTSRVYTTSDGERTLVTTLDECTEVIGQDWWSVEPCELDPPWTDASCGCGCP
jgi:hypothetical protein